jgi:hypothetical protein
MKSIHGSRLCTRKCTYYFNPAPYSNIHRCFFTTADPADQSYPAEYLITIVLEENDPAALAEAFGDIARAHGISKQPVLWAEDNSFPYSLPAIYRSEG